MPAYQISYTPTQTNLPARVGRGRMTFLLRLLFAVSGLVAASAVAHAGTVATPTFSLAPGTYNSAQTLTIGSTTPGALIVYTTDGSVPTESGGTAAANGALYFAPIPVNSSVTVQAIAFEQGLADSAVASTSYTINLPPAVVAPVFSPSAGTYTNAQSISITSATGGASIRYTTDGSTPSSTQGTLFYHGVLTLSSTATVNAIAYETGFSPSPVTSATYAINFPTPAAAPTFNPAGGTFTSVQSVTISSPTGGTSVAYTTDGSTPTEVAGNITHGSLYTGTLSFNTTVQLQAIAFGNGHTDSPVTSAIYQVDLPPPAVVPAFNPPTGQYETAQTVQIGSSTNGASIVYTTDGSTPTENGGTVTHGTQLANSGTINIPVGGVTTVNAIAFAPGYSDSAVGTATYTIVPAAAPTFSPTPGNYTTNSNFLITPSAATSGAVIVATTDGSTPSVNIAENGAITPANGGWYANNGVMLTYLGGFTGPITINAMTIAPGYAPSAVVAADYTISLPQAATPVLSPAGYSAGGIFYNAQLQTNDTIWIPGNETVTITSPNTNIDGTAAQIVYTVDGSKPSMTNGYGVTSGGTVVAPTVSGVLNAVAFPIGYTPSAAAFGNYYIEGWVDIVPTLTVGNSEVTYSLSDNAFAGNGAKSDSTLYPAGTPINAIAQGPGYVVWDYRYGTTVYLEIAIYLRNSTTLGHWRWDVEPLGSYASSSSIAANTSGSNQTVFKWTVNGTAQNPYPIPQQRLEIGDQTQGL